MTVPKQLSSTNTIDTAPSKPETTVKEQPLLQKLSTELCCNFCHKSTKAVPMMVAGRSGNICNECIATCVEVMNDYIVEQWQKK